MTCAIQPEQLAAADGVAVLSLFLAEMIGAAAEGDGLVVVEEVGPVEAAADLVVAVPREVGSDGHAEQSAMKLTQTEVSETHV